ncbi:MAG: cytochrome c3 family protein [Rhodocyclaceae bacterium]|nr:cytochrome c3 family protein [Rhodocyclaceae bacterium]
MRRLAVLLAVILGSALHASAWAAAPVSGSQCVECHQTESVSHAYHDNCASCHDDVEKHSKAAKPKTVKVGKPEAAQCLSCHESDKRRMHFAISEHNKAGVQCRDCHGNHTPKIKTLSAGMQKGGKTTALCATCHQDVLAKFSMTSHHPVKEGGATCTGCHDPHASKQATLGAKTAQCTQCHQAVRGPHAFEHPPAAEDCTNCHDPHGAPNKKLLTVAQPMQCLQCHSLPGNRHGQGGATNNTQRITGAVLRDCASCHGAIHGSSADQHLRF